jgi:hypothetical protein
MSITLNSTISNQIHLRNLTAQPRQSHKHYVINLLLYKIIQCFNLTFKVINHIKIMHKN